MEISWNCVFEFVWESCMALLYLGFLQDEIPFTRGKFEFGRGFLVYPILFSLPLSGRSPGPGSRHD